MSLQVTEDFNTTLSLHQDGWATIYYNEKLQWGMVPDTLRGCVRQRARWAMGNMQILRRKPLTDSRLSGAQRATYSSPGVGYFFNAFAREQCRTRTCPVPSHRCIVRMTCVTSSLYFIVLYRSASSSSCRSSPPSRWTC